MDDELRSRLEEDPLYLVKISPQQKSAMFIVEKPGDEPRRLTDEEVRSLGLDNSESDEPNT